MEFSLYALLPLLSAAALILLLVYIQRFQGLPAVQPFTLLVLLSIAYALTVAIVILNKDLSDKIFWAHIRLSTATFQSVCVLATSVEFSSRGKKLSTGILAAISIIPALTIFLSLSSSPLIFYDYQVIAPYPFLVSKFGAWYWIYILYAFGLDAVAFVMLARAARRLPSYYARQHIWLLIGLFIPTIFEVLYVFRIFPGFVVSIYLRR